VPTELKPLAAFSLSSKPLYFVTDHKQTGGRSQIEIVKAALDGGVRLVQYRDKDISDADFEKDARLILELCQAKQALLLINDRVQIAKTIGAGGVHLGQEDMHPTEARRILGPEAIIGLSTHNQEEVEVAQSLPVNYINIGPMFPTQTKDHSKYGALGLTKVLELSSKNRFPFTTMGGIKKSHLPELFRSGIQSVAMVTEISLAENPAARVRELLAEIHSNKI
jgi:thiamine-phosphate pyrophosphorylase